ncbi:hypothetical protein EGW08_023486, partial [Elysia chlorotica]
AGGVHKEILKVPVAGTRITWSVRNVTHPITLILELPDPPPDPVTCRNPLKRPLPLFMGRLKGRDAQQIGAASCPIPGDYKFTLDNRRDMVHLVRANAKLEVITPVGYIATFAEKFPLGDSVNFNLPITPEERQKRREIVKSANKTITFLQRMKQN